MTRLCLAVTIFALSFSPSLAQNSPPAGDCRQASNQEPATKPAPAAADGTAPGNAGSTGWSGGLGKANIGTTDAGSASNDFQPVTAKGLDLTGNASKAGC